MIAQNVGMEFFIKNFQIIQPLQNFEHYEKQNGRDCFIEADPNILKAIEEYRKIYTSGKRVNAPDKITCSVS